MRALVVTNMFPTHADPVRGRFVADQVAALRRREGLSVEVFAFDAGGAATYVRAARALRRRYGRRKAFDVVHAHFGLTAWPALAVPAAVHAVTLHGTDLAHPRSRPISLAALPWMDVVGVVSDELGERVPRWAARSGVEVLPCGVDLNRFRRIDRREARRALGLDPAGRYLLFPADPARPEKRHDLARALAGGVTLLHLDGVTPERVPLYVNAADVVLVTSDREGFGLAVLEALACDVPVLATPHGIAPAATAGVDGTLCGPVDFDAWRAAIARHLSRDDPRVAGRASAARFSSDAMAARVADTWQRAYADTLPGAPGSAGSGR